MRHQHERPSFLAFLRIAFLALRFRVACLLSNLSTSVLNNTTVFEVFLFLIFFFPHHTVEQLHTRKHTRRRRPVEAIGAAELFVNTPLSIIPVSAFGILFRHCCFRASEGVGWSGAEPRQQSLDGFR